MVQISNENNIHHISDAVYSIFRFQALFTHIIPVNAPNMPCLYSIWHAHQLGLHAFENRNDVSVMVSKSLDGEIIARIVEKWGMKTIRGSKNRFGAIEASKALVARLQNGESGVITVDGPHGPVNTVKNGIIKIARLAGAPIVPMYMYSPYPNLLKLPSWDKLRMPFFLTNIINLFGDPIYVDANAPDEDLEKYRLQLQKAMEDLEEQAPQKFKEVFKFGLWKNKNY